MWLQVTVLICLLIFVTAITWRIVRYARMPVHLRWELYPVAHEKNSSYGGSYLEETEWWHRPRLINPFSEFGTFMGEILFFKEYFRNKRGFWYFVYPFHIGLFFLLIWLLFIIIGAVIGVSNAEIASSAANPWNRITYYFTLAAGLIAFISGIFGSIGLLIKRSVNRELRNYTDPIDYFNLSCILLIFLAGLTMWLVEDTDFAATRDFMKALFILKPSTASPLLIIFVLASSLFLAYVPFTRMLHYVAKYFTYHKVRWDDGLLIKDGMMEKEIGQLMSQTINWSAKHIRQGKMWYEQSKETGLPDNTDSK